MFSEILSDEEWENEEKFIFKLNGKVDESFNQLSFNYLQICKDYQ